jgi:hypothetical protein
MSDRGQRLAGVDLHGKLDRPDRDQGRDGMGGYEHAARS